MHEDAMRRDFTINALYAAQDGTVFDPTGCGLSDIAAQKITFIGSAHDRIWEDHLRILRYYRFAASHGSGPADGDDLEACLQLGFLVSSLPRERIGAEMIKLFKADHAIRCLHTMKKSHLLAAIMPKLSIAHEVMEARFASVVLQENLLGLNACPYRRIAALVDEAPKDELKLSNLHADRIGKIISAANSPMAPSVLGYRFGYDIAEEALIHREATGNPGSVSAQSIDRARYGSQQVFPLKAKDIPDTFKGRALGSELKRLEALWISQGFSLL
jgi:poly(A) polymerase